MHNEAVRIAFTGHRDYEVEDELLLAIAARYPGAEWAHGGAVGFDSQVSRIAQAQGIQETVYRPDYAQHGRRAPLIRNDLIVAGAELLVACHDGRDHGGTVYTIKKAQALGIPVEVLPPARPAP